MNFVRILHHLLTGQFAIQRIFPTSSLDAIEYAIKQSELNHEGEICFAVEAALDTTLLLKNQTAQERAIEVFSQLRIWDTQYNNGVLIYLLLADRDIEIIADRGINSKVMRSEWENICHTMESVFQHHQFEAGIIEGITRISHHLKEHFPSKSPDKGNELPDKPVIL